MDQEKHPVRKRPIWAWLTVGGGITLIALVGASVVALSQRPVGNATSDRPVAATPSSPSDGQLAVTPPPPPVAPPPNEDPSPPTMGPPGSPPAVPPPSAPPIWPPTLPPSDLKGAEVGVPGPSQAIRPQPQPAPRRLAPAAPSSTAPRGGRDG